MTIYQEYAKAKQAIKALTLKVKELEPKILEEIKELSEPMKTDNGTFTTVERNYYKYSSSLVTKDKQLWFWSIQSVWRSWSKTNRYRVSCRLLRWGVVCVLPY